MNHRLSSLLRWQQFIKRFQQCLPAKPGCFFLVCPRETIFPSGPSNSVVGNE